MGKRSVANVRRNLDFRYGIPTMKLDKFVVDRRVKLMEAEGVKFLTNTDIGKDVPANFLLKVLAFCSKYATSLLSHFLMSFE